MRTFWGLMFAYWLSDRWKEAWTLTAVIIAFTVVSSKTGVWIAEASAELITGIALYHDPRTLDPMNTLIGSAVTLVALVVMKDVGIIGIRHLFSTTLHRKWRSFLNSRFNAALLDDNHTHFHLQNGMATTGPVGAGGLDNVDQRVQESIKGMTGGAIGLAMGIVGVTMSLLFVGMKLIETSNSVEGLEFLGAYATAVLALTAVAIYVPINTLVALRVGRVLEYLNATMQQTEGSYRGELTMFLRRSFQIAASGGERAQQALHDRLYLGIDRTWARLNRYSAGYMSFELIYNFFAARIVAYAPGFLSYTSGQIGLKNYVTGAELVNQLINECSWFIHVMPAIASLKANSRRVIELAVAIEDVQTPPDFYAKSGRSEFRYGTQDAKFGLTVRSLELTHQGHDVEPFMRAANMRFKPGSWTMIGGKYGGGKTSFLKALNGLWPYGRGMIVFPENVATLFAAQEIKLPRISLKQLVCLPHVDDGHSDVEVAAALHKAGLGQLIENLADEAREGVPWDQLLSGGQKQMLMLARILLHRPGLLFLDEATSALDPASRVAFHQALKDNCPDITVISIMHDAERPRAANGAEFYDHVVTIEDGMAVQLPIEVESIVSAQGAEPAAMRVPNVRLAEMVRAKPDR